MFWKDVLKAVQSNSQFDAVTGVETKDGVERLLCSSKQGAEAVVSLLSALTQEDGFEIIYHDADWELDEQLQEMYEVVKG